MIRTIGIYIGTFLLLGAAPAMAQETGHGTGGLEVTMIPAGATYFTSKGSTSMVGFTVVVADLNDVRELLKKNGVPFREFQGRLAVAASDACGSVVMFES